MAESDIRKTERTEKAEPRHSETSGDKGAHEHVHHSHEDGHDHEHRHTPRKGE